MDDFEDDELYDEYDGQIEDDNDDGESLKDKYDRAKEYKEKFDEYKEKYNNHKNKSTNNPASRVGKNAGKDTVKQGGKEATKETGKQAAKETGKQAAKETGKQAAKETGKQAAKETGKQAAKETGKQAAKQASKQAAKQGVKAAAEGALSSTGYGAIIAVAIEVADRLNELKKKLDKKADKVIEETTGVKDFSKIKKILPILLIIAIIMILFIIPAMAMYSASETASSELTTLVRARELKNDKELILFTKSEIKNLLNKDIEVDETIANKLADEGYGIEKKDDKYISLSYKSILEGYGSDLTNIFMPSDLTGISTGMEDVIEDSYDSLEDDEKQVAASLKNVRKYLLAEVENFNKVNWKKSNLNVDYGITGERKKKKYNESDGHNAYLDYLNDTNKITGLSGSISSQTAPANYTVKDKDGDATMLKTPNFSDMGVQGDKNERALSYVNMLSGYMQKWIVPYSIYIDTQDEAFVNGIMTNIYHPVDVDFFQLKKLTKSATFEYYMECFTYLATRSVYTADGEVTNISDFTVVPGTMEFGKNTKDETLGEHFISEQLVSSYTAYDVSYKEYEQTYKFVVLNATHDIAKDSNGYPMVKSVEIKRELGSAETIPEITYIGGFYEIIEKKFDILAIDETKSPNESYTGDMSVNETIGIGTQTLTETWNEEISLKESKRTDYELSYLTPEELNDLGRRVSIIEWYQDSKGMVSSQEGEYGAGSVSQTQQQYVDNFKEDALNDMNESGVLASITLAQGILEGGSGTSSLAATYNNHFGIKAGSSWTGATVTMRTAEYDAGGNRYTINAEFRAYSSAADSFADHSRFLWNTKGSPNKPGGYRYRDCTEYAKSMSYIAPDGLPTYDYRSAMQAIVDGGYCTDPVYVSKICSIIETYELYKIDRQSTWDGNPPDYATEGGGAGGSGGSGSSTGMGEVQYSYEDMEFAFYQIEKWYEQYSPNNSIINLADRVILPEGGFAWPVKITTSNPGAASIYKFYDVALHQGGLHRGLDISTGSVRYYDPDLGLWVGESVVAAHDGTVIKVQNVDDDGTTCKYIEIRTENGEFKTRYSYLSEIYVSEGDIVTKNQDIGRIGNTGGAHNGDTGTYLHYEMYYKGQNMDPLTYYNIALNGTKVDNYDELDLDAITNPTDYTYESSKTYLGGNSAALEIALQQDGETNASMKAKDTHGIFFGDHWCAMFVSWCLREAGIGPDVIAVSASCTEFIKANAEGDTLAEYYPQGSGYVPKPGDIIFFNFKGRPGPYGSSHVGIVKEVDSTHVHYVHGNTAGNSGGQAAYWKTSRVKIDGKTSLTSGQIRGYITY